MKLGLMHFLSKRVWQIRLWDSVAVGTVSHSVVKKDNATLINAEARGFVLYSNVQCKNSDI